MDAMERHLLRNLAHASRKEHAVRNTILLSLTLPSALLRPGPPEHSSVDLYDPTYLDDPSIELVRLFFDNNGHWHF